MGLVYLFVIAYALLGIWVANSIYQHKAGRQLCQFRNKNLREKQRKHIAENPFYKPHCR